MSAVATEKAFRNYPQQSIVAALVGLAWLGGYFRNYPQQGIVAMLPR